jgi:hypothetical protein
MSHWTENLGRDSDSLRVGRFGDRIPAGARFYAPVQTGLGAYPASHITVAVSFLAVKRPGSGDDHAPRLKKAYSYTSSPPLGLRRQF